MSEGPLVWLPAALARWGVTYRFVDGWRNAGRPTGAFTGKDGLLWHHTGAKASTANPHPALGVVVRGRPDLAGPLCNVSPDYTGVVSIVAAGRANHAGSTAGAGRGPIPASAGNRLVGMEIDYDGNQAMSTPQLAAAVLASCAILEHQGHDAAWAREHAETSITGKWDPGTAGKTIPGASIRALIAAQLKAGPPPLRTSEEDDMKSLNVWWTGKKTYKPNTWYTLPMVKAGTPSIETGPVLITGDLGVNLTGLTAGAVVQLRAVVVSKVGAAWTVKHSLGVDEKHATAGLSAYRTPVTCRLLAGERLRLQVNISETTKPAVATATNAHLLTGKV